MAAVAPPLEKAAVFQIVFNDNVGDGVHDKLDVAGVSGTSEVSVDVLCGAVTVQTFKPCSDVGPGFLVCVAT